jgi:hypothetical protein
MENKFRIWHDTQSWDVVDTINNIIKPYGLIFRDISPSGVDYMEYELIEEEIPEPSEEEKERMREIIRVAILSDEGRETFKSIFSIPDKSWFTEARCGMKKEEIK